MDIAVDRSGHRVRAKNAYRGGDYLCAECRVKVIYAAGTTQAPHFKHFPRTPAESRRIKTCQLYVADQQGYDRESAYKASEPPPPPRPRLAFAWAGEGSEQQRWALVVTVPVPPPDVKSLKVTENLNGNAEIPRALAIARRSVWVKARSIQYEVVGYDAPRTPKWRPEPTDLLRSDQPNVFIAGASGGLQLESEADLVRGGTYLTISSRASRKVPPASFSRQVYRLDACDPGGEWQGHLVYIPARKNSEIERWVETVCNRRVVDTPPRVEIVMPPARQIGPDGAYELDEGREVVLAVYGDDWEEPILELVDEASGDSREWPIGVFDGSFVSLGSLPPGRFAVHLRDRGHVSARIVVAPVARPMVAGVVLRTAPLGPGPDYETSLLSSEAVERWSNLVSGNEVLRGVDMPDGWPLRLTWESKAGGERVVTDLVSPSALSDAISELLASHPDRATLEAGPFGQVSWQRPPAPEALVSEAITLPGAVTARLAWLLCSRRTLAGPWLPLDSRLRSGVRRPVPASQTRLLGEFLDTPTWPASLLSHARSLDRDLAQRLTK